MVLLCAVGALLGVVGVLMEMAGAPVEVDGVLLEVAGAPLEVLDVVVLGVGVFGAGIASVLSLRTSRRRRFGGLASGRVSKLHSARVGGT